MYDKNKSKECDLPKDIPNAMFYSAFHNSPVPMTIITFPDGYYVDVNKSFSHLSGYDKQDVLGRTSIDIDIWVNPIDRIELIKTMHNQDTIHDWEACFRTKSGILHKTLFSATKIKLDNVQYLITSTLDITPLKSAEEALRQSQQQFKALVENSRDVIIRFDQLRCIYINPIIQLATGYASSFYIGKTLHEMALQDELVLLWEKQLLKVYKTKKDSVTEFVFTTFQGEEKYCYARFIPELNEQGSVEFILCTVRDITKMKKTELELRTSEARNQSLLNALPDILFIVNHTGTILTYKAPTQHLLYTTPDCFLGKTIGEVLPLELTQQIMRSIEEALQTGDMQSLEYSLTIQNVVYHFEARVVVNNNNEILFIVRDITELKRLKQEIARLEWLNVAGEIAVGIGHEIRNPLTTVRGFLQLLGRKTDCNKYQDYFNLMIEELDRANSIIAEFLSLAKNKSVFLETNNINNIINTLSPLLQANAILSNKYLKLELEPVPNLLLDANEIRQLILNLTRNGLEAMSSGQKLTIHTFTNEDSVILAVKDEGTGIAPEVLKKLGMPFFTTKDTGTGLGLAVCYRIAARHNAVITIDTSTTGTTFFITFKKQN